MGYAGQDALAADATRALPVFGPAGRDQVRNPGRNWDWYDVRYADSGRFPDSSWRQDVGWYPPRDASARPVVDWYDRYGRFPDDVPGSGY